MQAELVAQFLCCIPLTTVDAVLSWLKPSVPQQEQEELLQQVPLPLCELKVQVVGAACQTETHALRKHPAQILMLATERLMQPCCWRMAASSVRLWRCCVICGYRPAEYNSAFTARCSGPWSCAGPPAVAAAGDLAVSSSHAAIQAHSCSQT